MLVLHFATAPEEFKVSMNDKDFYAYLNGKGLPLDDCDKMRGN